MAQIRFTHGSRHPARDGKQIITSVTLPELTSLLTTEGIPTYRARQILEWVYQHKVTTFETMTNLPISLRQYLGKHWILRAGQVIKTLTSSDGTQKMLIKLKDGTNIETVLMSEGKYRTMCLSSQVGCPVCCRFCASGQRGLVRNLEPYEIVEQIQLAPLAVRRLNLVIMGMGEPLLNYTNLVKALEIITVEWGLNISPKRITLSTVGIPDKIRQLSREPVSLVPNLALSTHAPNDVLRRKLIPFAHLTPLAKLITALREYHLKTGREITFEYLLLGGVNDATTQAEELADLIKGRGAKVNLINYNTVAGLPDKPSEHIRYAQCEPAQVLKFQEVLRARGILAFIRKSKGQDIAAACGQLALSTIQNS